MNYIYTTKNTPNTAVFNEFTYNEKIKPLIDSAMIKHKYCFMPILNYLELKSNKFIDFTDENVLYKALSSGENIFPENIKPDKKKIKYNPRYICINEIMLLGLYKQIKNGKTLPLKYYNLLNLAQYNVGSEYYNKKKKALGKYFNSITLSEKNDKGEAIYCKHTLNLDKNGNHPNLKKFKIGIYNTKVSYEDIKANIQKQDYLNFNELQSFIRFLNLSIQCKKPKCDLIVFPEVCVPFQALGLLADFSRKHNVAIVCGLKHLIDKDKNVALNYIATLLPFSINKKTDTFINLRLKKWYSPAEIKLIKKLGYNIPETDIKNDLFIWNDLHFAVYDCFELADINFRSEFKSDIDFLVACEWNKDIKYFSNIVESVSRDLHCYAIQVNTSQYGDSKIVAPKKSEEMTILNIKGGDDNILIGEINIEELRDFQRNTTEYLDKDEFIFKPLPPDFNNKAKRLTK